jgi:hypothetical protein
MIALSIILCVFANCVRWADLADNTTTRSLKDYINYSNKTTIVYNIIWVLITFIIWAISKGNIF